MKKSPFIIALFALSVISCKKNYTCECVYTSNGVEYQRISPSIFDTKKKAKAECEDLSSSSTSNGVTTASSCSLKD